MQFFLLKHGESRLIEIKEADKDLERSDSVENYFANGHVHVDNATSSPFPVEDDDDDDIVNVTDDADELQQLVDQFVEGTHVEDD